MAEENNSDSSTSESEISACSSKYDPMKALYSKKTVLPVKNAPAYETVQQYEDAQKMASILPVGSGQLVQKREEEKKAKKAEEERLLQEKNKQRFERFQLPTPVRKEKKSRNLLTRIDAMRGPLAVLKECVDKRLRIKVITRHATGVRGVLHATLVAFDKQWNLALSDVLEVWKRKGVRKRKVPPGLCTPVEKGTASKIFPVPVVTETPVGGGVWECTRHIPQMMMRGEHVIIINVVER
ncbi:hypothetical protein ACJJTC_006141 [Scirpophaga incertulas]